MFRVWGKGARVGGVVIMGFFVSYGLFRKEEIIFSFLYRGDFMYGIGFIVIEELRS